MKKKNYYTILVWKEWGAGVGGFVRMWNMMKISYMKL